MKRLVLGIVCSFAIVVLNYLVAERLIPPLWFNHTLHFLVGACGGWVVGAVWEFRFPESFFAMHWMGRVLFIFFASVGIVGAGYELFEFYYFGRDTLSLWTHFSLYEDTMRDLTMDFWGAAASALLFVLSSIAIRRFR